ncbi:MAG: orotate phosphoribosyltransferase [Acidimicrobiia bacterium]
MSRDALIDHLKANALRLDGPFTLRSGATSSWYLDGRQVTFDGEGSWIVGQAFHEALMPSVDAVGGMTMGADPIAVATAMVASREGRSLKAFSIRKETKDHGTGGRLVGPVSAGDRVALVEDATTTGGATREAAEAAISGGLEIVQVIVMVDRSGGAAEENLSFLGVPFVALVTPEDLGVTG